MGDPPAARFLETRIQHLADHHPAIESPHRNECIPERGSERLVIPSETRPH